MSLSSIYLLLCAADALAGTPVVVDLRGANVGSSEPIVVRFIGDDASVVEVQIADNGRSPDFIAEDGTWAGRGVIEGDGFQLRLVAGTRSMPAARVEWSASGDRHLSLVVRGNELDAYPTIETESTLAAAAEQHRERWGAPFFWVFAGLVVTIALAERWGLRDRVVGLRRVADPPVLDGSRHPRGAIRVEQVEASATRLVETLAATRTVLVVGRFAVPLAAPGRIFALKSAEPERLIAAVAARSGQALTVVVAVPEGQTEEWLEVVAELAPEVPVFVLVAAGAQPPELGEVAGELAWLV